MSSLPQETKHALSRDGFTPAELEILAQMYDKGVTYGALLGLTGSQEKAAEFLDRIGDWAYGAGAAHYSVGWPSLYQEGEYGDWQGQPIVWDGGFRWDGLAGKLYYEGARGPSGEGGAASRVVQFTDVITW